MFGNQPYDRFGNVYNVSQVLTPQDTFNLTAYEEYSPLYLPAAFSMTYLIAFALSTNVIVHTLLYHGRALLHGFKRIRFEEDDIHFKLMQNYPEVPDWWYGTVFVIFFGMAIIAAEVRRHMANGANTEPHEPGVEDGYACLGTPTLRVAADRLCTPFGLYLRNDWSSCAQTPSSRCAPSPSDIRIRRFPSICLLSSSLGRCFPASRLQTCFSRPTQCSRSRSQRHSYRT